MINILLFAHLQETIGKSTLHVDLANHTVGQIKKWMEVQYPQLTLKNIMAAVNESFVTDDTIVKDGDTLAFIPPISGG